MHVVRYLAVPWLCGICDDVLFGRMLLDRPDWVGLGVLVWVPATATPVAVYAKKMFLGGIRDGACRIMP